MIPQKILDAYDIGDVQTIESIKNGLIHKTFRVVTSRGSFIAQQLHEVLLSDGVGRDVLAVTEHLKKKGFLAPEVVLNRRGEIHTRFENQVWRWQTCFDGFTTYHTIERPSLAFEAGALYAKFHKVMDDCTHAFENPLVLHQTEKIYEEFCDTVTNCKDQALLESIADEIQFVKQTLPTLFLPHDVPLRVIHSDPKISNILFDSQGHAKVLVDLDTCNRSSIFGELGDAFRSWCGRKEDDGQNEFQLAIFEAGWKGYFSEGKGFLTEREISLLPQAIGAIIVELVTRFLADVINDSYFGWDEKAYPSRRAHNLARVRGQRALYEDFVSKKNEISQLIH